MQIVRDHTSLNDAIALARNAGKNIGFVPTMGALHEGHLSLIHKARDHADFIVVSIFVNPTQFAPHEDFDSYPRHEEADAAQLRSVGVDLLFFPTEEILYPDGYETEIKAGAPQEGLETTFRPHFFDGVVNVVSRLFDVVKPDCSIFGEKDFQQLQVIQDMVERHNMDVEIIGAPIMRDEGGLALSSRNQYLSDKEIKIARNFNVILKETAAILPENSNPRLSDAVLAMAKGRLLEAGFDKVDYIEKRWGRILGAGWVGKTRLIDNVAVE